MSGSVPVEPPSANAYLVQQAERLRLAIRDIQQDISLVEARFREINHSLTLVVAALDQLDDERNESNNSQQGSLL